MENVRRERMKRNESGKEGLRDGTRSRTMSCNEHCTRHSLAPSRVVKNICRSWQRAGCPLIKRIKFPFFQVP